MGTPSSPPVTTPFSGIWPALLTPLDASLGIDHAAFARHAAALIQGGCGGVTPFGTTGEGPSFSVDERRAAVDALVAGGVPGERIVVSTSCAALPDVVSLTQHALSIDAHGCLMLPPFFLQGVPDDGVVDAFRWVIDAVADPRLRIYLYHIPQVSGVPLSHEVIARLKALYPETIVGIKDSGCDRASSLALADAFIDRLMVYVGNEPDLPTLGARGSIGAISGLANFMPRTVHRMVCAPHDAATPEALARVQGLLKTLGGYALTPALKGILALQSGDRGWLRVRPPLRGLSDAAFETLSAQLQPLGLDALRD